MESLESESYKFWLEPRWYGRRGKNKVDSLRSSVSPGIQSFEPWYRLVKGVESGRWQGSTSRVVRSVNYKKCM